MENSVIIGIYEVGRGPIAGPVTVCAFAFLSNDYESYVLKFGKENKLPLRDSKKLTKIQKQKWYDFFIEEKKKGNCTFAVSSVSSVDIDKYGISKCIQKALGNSLNKVSSQIIKIDSKDEKNLSALPLAGAGVDSDFTHPALLHIFSVYLDGGLKAPACYVNQKTIIKGDELYPVISCASIVAKVTRDEIMRKYNDQYVGYGFDQNAGYGTAMHYVSISKHGITPIHR